MKVFVCTIIILTFGGGDFSFSSYAQGSEGESIRVDTQNEVEKSDSKSTSTWEEVKKTSNRVLEKGKESVTEAVSELDSTKAYREAYSHNLLGTFSLLDTWIPGKWGGTYTYNKSASSAWEFEYLKGTYAPIGISELGEFSDLRLTLFYRSFSKRNSFNFMYGIYYNSFKLGIGDAILNRISSGYIPNFDVVSIETMGISWGFGNRWHLKRFLFAVDWFTINIPLVTLESEAPFLETTTSQEDKNDIRDAMDIIEKIPTLAIFKLQFGYSF